MSEVPTISETLAEAISALGVADEVVQLSAESARQVVAATEERFVDSPGRRWWWEALTLPSAARSDSDGYRLLQRLVPDSSAPLYLIASDESDEDWPVYEASAKHIEALLGECQFFEYYVVPSDFAWLVCETHHNQVIAAGEPVRSRLEEMAA